MVESFVRNFISGVFFPTYCAVCAKPGAYVCRDCFYRYLNVSAVQRCHVCGRECRVGLVHLECQETTFLDGVLFVSVYTKLLQDLIHRGKYSDEFSIFSDLGLIMSQYIANYDFKNCILVPVPMYWKKKNERGFNQAEILCRTISKKGGIPSCNVLKRIKDTKTQVGLTKESRINNVRGAFSINDKDFKRMNSQCVILVDDVFTTGSTLEQCAQLLKENGASKVYGFTFAKSRISD